MNKNLFFDIQLGASGDMLIGSLLDLGSDYKRMMYMLNELKLSDWTVLPEKIVKHSITGTSANVRCKDHTHHRNISDIKNIIHSGGLPKNITRNIINIFENLSIAEAKVHGKKPEEIHFHEIGAVDSIIDISAFCILTDLINIDQIYYNDFPFGTGTIISAHGEIPVPVPAVVELTKNYRSRSSDKPGELITPTAVAILTTLGKQIQPSDFTVINSGIGFGTREHPFPSYTRVFLIENNDKSEKTNSENQDEHIQQFECNIDDMNPQLYPGIIQMVLDAGALDAYFCSIFMKKGRPGFLLSVIADAEIMPKLKEILYSNTTTLGSRIFNVCREKLSRKYKKVNVFNEEIRIKLGYLKDKVVNVHPEFDDCRKAAEKLKIPLKEIMTEAVYQYNVTEREIDPK
jgi:pyridinium-3,5-bisthiocarboxylic acid mononucleotide nickel chelatase